MDLILMEYIKILVQIIIQMALIFMVTGTKKKAMNIKNIHIPNMIQMVMI
jgi:hypothetical protein